MPRVCVGLPRLALTGTLMLLSGCSDAPTEFSSTSQASFAPVESTPLRDMNPGNGVSSQEVGTTTSQASLAKSISDVSSRDISHPELEPSPSRPLPLPWADFAEMHEPNLDVNMSATGWPESGFLIIEDDCVYLELVDFEEPYPSEHRRVALSFPRGWTQYDSDTGKIFVHQRSGFVYGPFVSGDFVSTPAALSRGLSDTCDDRQVLSTWDVAPCAGNYTRHRIRCPHQQYSTRYEVVPSEARRQLALIPELQGVLERLRAIEHQRFAGWGIDRNAANGAYGAWLWLTGPSPPSEAAQRLADEHGDVELRTGAEFSYEELERALMEFDSGSEFYLPPSNTSVRGYSRLELRSIVLRSYVDHRANRLEVAIDTLRIPRPVGSAVLTGDASAIADRHQISRDELEAVIGDVLAQHLEVPVRVTHRWP